MHPLMGALMAIYTPPRNVFASLTDLSITHTDVELPGLNASAAAAVRLRNDGVLQKRQGLTYTDIPGEWLVAGLISEFQIRFEHVSGTLGTGVTMNTWGLASVTKDYQIQATRNSAAGIGVTTVNSVVRVLIRDALTLQVLDQALFTLQANAELAP